MHSYVCLERAGDAADSPRVNKIIRLSDIDEFNEMVEVSGEIRDCGARVTPRDRCYQVIPRVPRPDLTPWSSCAVTPAFS